VRVDARSGEAELVARRAHGRAQLRRPATDATAHHARHSALANEVVTLHLTRRAPGGRRLGTRMRFDTPLHGTFDGREVVVLPAGSGIT
jgi:hypothetical protein